MFPYGYLDSSILFFFLDFWLHWVFVAVHRLSLAAVGGGYFSLYYVDLSLWWLVLLRSTGSRHLWWLVLLQSTGSRHL